MEDAIYLVQADGKLVEMTVQPYESEPLLQELLEKYPHLLAGGQMNEDHPRQWLLIAREMGIAWENGGGDQLALDHLFLDQDGVPTLVEVKRSSDTRIRREVVGQMLEYAANAVVYWPVEKLQARFESQCENTKLDPTQALSDFLSNNGNGEPDPERFWQQVRTNLQLGRIRMVFVADEIPFQLRRIVEFLNEQMSVAEILAVEVKQYVGQGLQTLVPRLIGRKTQTEKPNPEKRWDETSFFDALAKRNEQAEVQVAKRLLAWARVHMPEIWWGKGKQIGSFIPGIRHQGEWHQLIGVWTNGYIELQFQYMKTRGTLNDEQRRSLLNRVNQIVGSALPEKAINRRPSLPLASLAKPNVLDAFVQELEWALGLIRNETEIGG